MREVPMYPKNTHGPVSGPGKARLGESFDFGKSCKMREPTLLVLQQPSL